MPYIGQSLTEGTRREYTYVATASQTVFPAIYTVGAVDVHQNGILLPPSDYTATDGTTVVFATGCAVNDEVVIHCHNTFSVADTYRKADTYTKTEADDRFVNASGDTMSGNFNVGDASSDDVPLSVDRSGQDIKMRVGGVTSANQGENSSIRFQSQDTGGTNVYADIRLEPEGKYLAIGDPGTSGATLNEGPMRIDTSGNISVYNAQFQRRMNIAGTDPSSSDYISIGMLGVSNSINAGIDFCRSDGVTKSGVRSINGGAYSKKGLGFFTNHASDYTTQATEKMRITSDGYVLVNQTSVLTGGVFEIGYHGSSTYGAAFHPAIDNGRAINFKNAAGSTVGSITNSSSATSYNTSSDYRLKEDIQPMVGAADRVLALNPVNFAWKADGTRVDGFLAHEAQAVVPEAVTGSKDAVRTEEYEVTPEVEETYDDEGNVLTERVAAVMGTREVPEYQSIDQSKLVPLLTAALQEALTEIAALKDRVAALEPQGA